MSATRLNAGRRVVFSRMTTHAISLGRLLSRAALALLLVWAQSAAAAVLDGIVVGVTDGDTVTGDELAAAVRLIGNLL